MTIMRALASITLPALLLFMLLGFSSSEAFDLSRIRSRFGRQSSTTPSGLDHCTIDMDGLDRDYYIHLPPQYKSSERLPLVLVLHGGGKGDALTVEGYLGFTPLSDRKGFIVVYPNGVDSYWRDGRGYTHRGKNADSIDDVAFISRLIDHLVSSSKADPERIYVTGISNGGMMTLRLGCELSDKLAAIAPIAANMPENLVNHVRPVSHLPVLLMNGTEDPLVPYNGGNVHFLRKEMGLVASTASTIAFWVRNNGCDPNARTGMLPDRNPDDGSRVKVSVFSGRDHRSEVRLYSVQGGGHTLPGSNVPDRPRVIGRKNMDINGAAVIWKFFSRHPRKVGSETTHDSYINPNR